MMNVGIIGMGIGRKHVLAYKNNKNTNIKKICDFDSKKLPLIKKEFPNIEIVTSSDLIIEDNGIDIVSIASYDNYHFEQIMKSIKYKKHIFAEKPICMSLTELVEIYQALAENKSLLFSANHVLRTNSRFKKLKRNIKRNDFGDIFYLEGDYLWGRKEKLYGWRSNMDYYSIIYGAAIHMIDLIVWLINEKPINVQAMGNNIATKDSNLKFNSFAVILLEFENGIIVKLTGNGGCVHPHFHGLKIFGTKKTAIHNIDGAYYLKSSQPSIEKISISESYPEKETREKVIHSFIDTIMSSSNELIVSQKDIFNIMSICFAAEEAMISGKKISINYLV